MNGPAPRRPITLRQLRAQLADRTRMDDDTTERCIRELTQVITGQLLLGAAVTMPDLGTFHLTVHRRRERGKILARHTVVFTPSRALYAELRDLPLPEQVSEPGATGHAPGTPGDLEEAAGTPPLRTTPRP